MAEKVPLVIPVPWATVQCMRRFKKWNPKWNRIRIVAGNFQRVSDAQLEQMEIMGFFLHPVYKKISYLRPFLKGWFIKNIDDKMIRYNDEMRIEHFLDIPIHSKYADFEFKIGIDPNGHHDVEGFLKAVVRCLESGNSSETESDDGLGKLA